MADDIVRFDATGGSLVLSNAILLYRAGAQRHANPYAAPGQDASAFASIHSVQLDDEGRPTIAAGTPLSRAHLRQWTEALGRTTAPELLPDKVLVAHTDMLNVFADGRLCWGNIVRPTTLGITSIPAFERAVFDSWSTHPNPGQDLTVTGKGGLVKLWDDLASRKAKRFPVGRLKPFMVGTGRHGRQRSGPGSTERMTLGRLIARGGR